MHGLPNLKFTKPSSLHSELLWQCHVNLSCAHTLQNILPLLGHITKYCVKVKFRSLLRLSGNLLNETYINTFTPTVRNTAAGNIIWGYAELW